MRKYSGKIMMASTLALFCGLSGGAAQANAPAAIGFNGALPNLNDVDVESGHVYDYTFASAPTDWRVQAGVWEMTNRWSCSPGWSWFGGRSEEVASIWNKRKFSGDFSVQFYFAFKMGLTGTKAWMEKPSDAAITVCGDGKNLGSGYTFIMGANDNTHSVLLKQGEQVAESAAPAALMASMADGRASDEALHRKWWYAKISRVGNRIECWLDNKLLFTYNDPQPIEAGQMALWTYNNGLMLSRVQVFYENEVKSTYNKTKSPVIAVNAPVKPATVVKTAAKTPAKSAAKSTAKATSASTKIAALEARGSAVR